MRWAVLSVLACDIRIAESHAQMALPELSVGLLPPVQGYANLPWLVGEGWAKRMILCGERIKADKALQIGLVKKSWKVAKVETALELAPKWRSNFRCDWSKPD